MSFVGVSWKRSSENMQQSYRKTPRAASAHVISGSESSKTQLKSLIFAECKLYEPLYG